MLHNLTEANFANVEVRVRVSGEVKSWSEAIVTNLEEDDEQEPLPPERPAVLGTRKPFHASVSAYGSNIHFSSPIASAGPTYSVEDDGSVAIRFEPVDLRPEERLPLDEVPVLVLADPRTVLDCQWTATASNVPGRLSGRFALTVVESTLDPAGLTAEADRR